MCLNIVDCGMAGRLALVRMGQELSAERGGSWVLGGSQ